MVSRDSEVQQSVAEVFAETDLYLAEDSLAATDLIARRHFDGFIIDCDGLKGGTELITTVRGSRANRKSVIFTIVDEKTSAAEAMELGSNFVLRKPLETDDLATYFQSSV